MLNEAVFQKIGNSFLYHHASRSDKVGKRRFQAMFGVSSLVCSVVWSMIKDKLPDGATPSHLMWALLFLKCYNTEEVNRTILKADEKTMRKWVWIFVDRISRLRVVINIIC